MTEASVQLLLWSAATVALLHTLIGVDHYLPFVVIGKARRWPLRRTLAFTAACGVGHVTGSVVLGLVGVGLGVAVQQLEVVESVRGALAAWGLIAFGLVYAGVSAYRTARQQRHVHVHAHVDGTVHSHAHDHQREHAHPHTSADGQGMTRWALFLLFVLGPCEALIPMFMVPAFAHDWFAVIAVAAVFSAVTIITMLAAVSVGCMGLAFTPGVFLERHANTLAGLAIAGSGLGIQLLGI